MFRNGPIGRRIWGQRLTIQAMKKLCLCLGLIWSAFALAQGIPDLRVLDTQNTSGTPFNIPLEMVLRTVFTPLMHMGLQLSDVQYISPKPSNNFSLRSIQDDDSWMELQTLRWEGGLGLNYIIKKGFVMGLIPFKGSLVTSIRRKEKNATIPKIEMPTSFDDITSWRTGDYASFQTYGGIEALVGANFVTGLSGQVMFVVQNQFIVEFEKTSDEEVVVSVAEENLHKRNLA